MHAVLDVCVHSVRKWGGSVQDFQVSISQETTQYTVELGDDNDAVNIWCIFKKETIWPDLPVCICEYATMLACHHSQIQLWCLQDRRCLLLQTPTARWSAWFLCSPLECPSGSASRGPWRWSLHTYGSGSLFSSYHAFTRYICMQRHLKFSDSMFQAKIYSNRHKPSHTQTAIVANYIKHW